MPNSRVPASATLIRFLAFLLPGPPERRGELRLWHGAASDGFKTAYERRNCVWLEASLDSCLKHGLKAQRQCWRFSGPRMDQRADAAWKAAARNVDENKGEILQTETEPAGATWTAGASR